MSDGAISQDEIEALLSGVSLGGGSPMGGASPMPSMGASLSMDTSVIQNFVSGTVGALSSGLETMTGISYTVGSPVVEATNTSALLQKLPDMVVVVNTDFSAGLFGQHSFILSTDFTKKVSTLVTKEEAVEVDEMALSVISEFVSQHVGTEITALASKFPGLSSIPANPALSPKSAVQFIQDNFVLVSYPVSGNGEVYTIWEVLGQSVAQEITNAMGGGSSMGDSSMGSGLSADELASLGNFGGSMGGGMNMGGSMGMPNMNIPNVQSLQYPNLQQGIASGEQGNIGLIMDVYMEMTVELGRTKKQIKEILGMGEGTIIELDKLAGEPVDILVNHKPIAKGEVVVIDENFGVRVTEILSVAERFNDMR